MSHTNPHNSHKSQCFTKIKISHANHYVSHKSQCLTQITMSHTNHHVSHKSLCLTQITMSHTNHNVSHKSPLFTKITLRTSPVCLIQVKITLHCKLSLRGLVFYQIKPATAHFTLVDVTCRHKDMAAHITYLWELYLFICPVANDWWIICFNYYYSKS